MAVDVATLVADLADESADLTALVAGLDEADWRVPTPAVGWDVLDQVAHLAFFDEVATLAATDAAAFEAERKALVALGEDFPDVVAARFRDRTGADVLGWFERARAHLLTTLGAVPAAAKLPWFSRPMSAATSLTARLMETWAHGQDVADALGVPRTPSARLRHVAHLGVATIPWGFSVHGRPAPAAPPRVELTAPAGDTWVWGPPGAANVVRGPALDFCLLVTQRRHHRDLALTATGDDALAFLEVAQVFAGPPAPGRAPGGQRP
ncbi:TIGR03084 family protein [Frankia sp. CNm7]|uniref:TIGR03084 family protein n=1 Tax=Frankia nepalensis TaxID=1836974 RepID=A0A937RE36_9ACTN|nr:TIGR03084 family metal-binding protein [Frankia nepalensis]MBL7499224.1 TIGR03084 family protein [Frankia nepalensis]MBL7512130.1 TIGR03084 family protein [Frankia nepalensis]MBL7520901.1 TIGR03084 family protein [Frankia nepalensis]MBL7627295.1 TIGR03084 family protein [Frankia nepalensis]